MKSGLSYSVYVSAFSTLFSEKIKEHKMEGNLFIKRPFEQAWRLLSTPFGRMENNTYNFDDFLI